MRTSWALGGATSMSSMEKGFWVSHSTAALHLITWKMKGYCSSMEIITIVSFYFLCTASVHRSATHCYIEMDTSHLQGVITPWETCDTIVEGQEKEGHTSGINWCVCVLFQAMLVPFCFLIVTSTVLKEVVWLKSLDWCGIIFYMLWLCFITIG